MVGVARMFRGLFKRPVKRSFVARTPQRSRNSRTARNTQKRMINDIAMGAIKSGMLILGGSVIKHHICNANLMRNGANWSVFINTGNEFDGSDSGARPDEAVSWGKIRLDAIKRN